MENTFENALEYVRHLDSIEHTWSESERTLATAMLSYAAKTSEKSDCISDVSDMLTVDYLQHMHTITDDEAASLLEFAKSHTIQLKGCYGDGSIIYPMWKEANYR